ncbi:hypothetical protein GCK32_018710, partial [Trichostrongylus colubriformis]
LHHPALDLRAPVSPAGFQCFRNNLYNVAFIRAYTPVGSGQIDTYACTNIKFAVAAGMGAEVYMTPQPNSVKTGAQQFDEMYNNLRDANIFVQSVWIQKSECRLFLGCSGEEKEPELSASSRSLNNCGKCNLQMIEEPKSSNVSKGGPEQKAVKGLQ